MSDPDPPISVICEYHRLFRPTFPIRQVVFSFHGKSPKFLPCDSRVRVNRGVWHFVLWIVWIAVRCAKLEVASF